MNEPAKFPVRINRFISLQKLCSRREADRLIAAGCVQINGRLAKTGEIVREGDRVEIAEVAARKIEKERVYLAYNKPAGIATHPTGEGQESIADILHYPQKVFPIGRLDQESRGLILLTSDGRITDRMLNPRFFHEKEYEVETKERITPDFIRRMGAGVAIGGYITKKCEVEKLDAHTFRIVLTEGKNRQIRKMCAVLNREVTDLVRTRIMNIELAELHPGKYRKIEGKELSSFLRQLDLE